MRRILVLSLLLVGAGCHGLRDHVNCRKGHLGCATTEPCPEKKVVKAEPLKVTSPPPTEVAVPTISQDILLVPVTSYVPYARTTPTGPVRMALPPNVTTPPPPSVGDDKPQVAAPPTVEKETVKKLLEICEKQCERIDHLEKCIKDRHANPPPPVCPPPLLRRPLFNRCEPLFPRCEPMFQRCEPLVPCEPADKKSSVTPSGPPEVQPSVLTIH